LSVVPKRIIMTTLQEYLNDKYPTKEDKENVEKIVVDYDNPLKEIDGGELDLSEYPNLWEIKIVRQCLKSFLTKLELGNKYKLVHLSCRQNRLTNLDVSNCPNLEELYCGYNLLTNLNLNKCPKLSNLFFNDNQLTSLDCKNNQLITRLSCDNNKLTDLNFLHSLPNKDEFTYLNISKNNFPPQDLSFLIDFINLESLYLNDNQFFGSLEPLKNLIVLETLDISSTKIDSGLEYLPGNLLDLKHDSRNKNIYQKLYHFESYYFDAWRLTQDFYQKKLTSEQLNDELEMKIEDTIDAIDGARLFRNSFQLGRFKKQLDILEREKQKIAQKQGGKKEDKWETNSAEFNGQINNSEHSQDQEQVSINVEPKIMSETSSLRRNFSQLDIQDTIKPAKRTKTESFLKQPLEAREKFHQVDKSLTEINSNLASKQVEIKSLQVENQHLLRLIKELR
jgi:hypothetical protein